MLEFRRENYSVQWLLDQYKKGRINTDISIQRQEVWNSVHKSHLIISVLRKNPITSLKFEKDMAADRPLKVIDGKQRVITLCLYAADGFALAPEKRYSVVCGVDVSGKRFSELPEEFQETILEYQLAITIMDPMDDEERNFVFYMDNQSVRLTAPDLFPSILGEEKMRLFEALSSHPFMTGHVKLTKTGTQNKDYLNIFLQYLIMRFNKPIGFSRPELMNFCDDIHNDLVRIPAEEINSLMDYVDQGFGGGRSFFKKVHLPSIFYLAQKEKESGVLPEVFAEKIDRFFMEIKQEDHHAYNKLSQGASAKRINIQRRLEMMSRFVCD